MVWIKDNKSLNKSRATNKNPNNFYKVLTFKWHVSKFEPSRIISLQITVINMKLLLQIFKTMEKSEFHALIKLCFLMGKNTVQAKQWFDKCYSVSSLSETMVKRWNDGFKNGRTATNDAEHSGYPKFGSCSRKHQKLQ